MMDQAFACNWQNIINKYCLMLELDENFYKKLTLDLKILRKSKQDWSIDQVISFTALLNIDKKVEKIIKQYEIDGHKLFDIQYLQQNLESLLNEKNFMPLYKIYFVVEKLILDGSSIIQTNEGYFNKKNASEEPFHLHSIVNLNISGKIIQTIKAELLEKYQDIPIIQLTNFQLFKILKNADLMPYAEMCKKFSLDGFSLVCILADQNTIPIMKNYFSEEEIQELTNISNIFMPQYFRQNHKSKRSQQQLKKVTTNQSDFNHYIEFEKLNLKNVESQENQFGSSQIFEEEKEDYGGRSSCAKSLANSEFVQEGSNVRHSMAESYAQSEILEDLSVSQILNKCTRISNNIYSSNIRVSSIEDDTTLKALKYMSLRLSFNLLNLEPLQFIKITSISYPLNREKKNSEIQKTKEKQEDKSKDKYVDTDCSSNFEGRTYTMVSKNDQFIDSQCKKQIGESKTFHLSGVKFGRNPDNDFSYPDDLAISGKHAQIVFKNDTYYIRDLGSKTGTFLYISKNKPLVLADGQYIQLSNEVEFKVRIIKREKNEGIIKLEFKKPENEPAYKASFSHKEKNFIRIGSSTNSHIILNKASISTKHAELKYENETFTIYDCNSRNGTWLRLSVRGQFSRDKVLEKNDIFRISAKKVFTVEEISQKNSSFIGETNTKLTNEEEDFVENLESSV